MSRELNCSDSTTIAASGWVILITLKERKTTAMLCISVNTTKSQSVVEASVIREALGNL